MEKPIPLKVMGDLQECGLGKENRETAGLVDDEPTAVDGYMFYKTNKICSESSSKREFLLVNNNSWRRILKAERGMFSANDCAVCLPADADEIDT
jgi:hypothetical protein